LTIDLSFFEATDIGKRGYNQDYFAHMISEKAACFVVADGLGGHDHGEIASKMLCEALMAEVTSHIEDINRNKLEGMQRYLQRSYERMQQVILAEQGAIDTHTTLALAWLDDSQLITAHVGDSRVYRLNTEKVLWRTPDHTRVQSLFKQGKITEDKMGKHSLQNKLSRTVNLLAPPDVEIFIHLPLQQSETLLLCTDGFWTDTSFLEMVKLTNRHDFAQAYQERITELAQHPFADNITLQVVKLTLF